jgi:uncharacterized membrane protein
MFAAFGLMALFVFLTRELSLLDPNSFFHRRYAPIPWLMVLHGIPGLIALLIGPFQFSNRLRQKHLQLHRIMGRLYIGSAVIAVPFAIVIATKIGPPALIMAATIQSIGWLLTAGTALYCIRTGRIQQHREWMMRSYPFAMVFIVARVVTAFPQVQRLGDVGIVSAVWSVIATACFLPSFVIAWQNMPARRRRIA